MSKEMPGVWSKEATQKAVKETNTETHYSRNLEVFKPVNIKMLVDFSADLQKDSVYQMMIYPNGQIRVGIFNEQGSGSSYLSVEKDNLKEGVHFVFE